MQKAADAVVPPPRRPRLTGPDGTRYVMLIVFIEVFIGEEEREER
jgi:hypothetical protein